jgi:predicted dehydrogenase
MAEPANNDACKRIGLVDYCLDNFHADVLLKSIRQLHDARRFAVTGAFALESTPSAAWAQRNGVEYFDQLVSLDARVDYYMILAPSNPERHLELCARVFPCRKTTFVDKTFAPDWETARMIFELADQYGVAVQSSSALRYTDVQLAVRRAGNRMRHLAVWAGGSSLNEYAIHPVEMVVSCLGANATSVARFGTVDYPLIALQYENGRTAAIHMNARSHVPYQAAVSTDEATEFITVDNSHLFLDATSAILDLFDAGVPSIDRAETLLVRQVLDIISASAALGQVVPLHREHKLSPLPSPKGIFRKQSAVIDSRG